MKQFSYYTSFYRISLVGVYLFALIGLTACSDWFDTSPKTDLTAEKLFSTESGFESSLVGIYLLMTNQSAYGGNMTFGLLDQLAQEYDYIPMELTTGRPSIIMKLQHRVDSVQSNVLLRLGSSCIMLLLIVITY